MSESSSVRPVILFGRLGGQGMEPLVGSYGGEASGSRVWGPGAKPNSLSNWDIFDALTAILGTEKQHN